MRTILFIIQKEVLQIRRNRLILPLLFVMPFIQLIILGHAANFEVKNLNLCIVDKDQSSFSHKLISKFSASKYYRIVKSTFDSKEASQDMLEGRNELILEIPQDFEKKLIIGEKSAVNIRIDAVNGMKAGIANAYTTMIINNFNTEIMSSMTGKAVLLPLDLEYSFWYNPEMNYSTFMVPGILVMLVTMIGSFVTAIVIVREKEIGTIEQLNVTPIKKYQLILGKLFTFFIIGFLELSLGLLIAKFVFKLTFVGSIWLVYGFTLVYLPVVLGLGLLISTITNTQQQAMFMAWFVLLISILLSGLFTPIESMPGWIQNITLFNPIRYFVAFMRMVLLKGSTFSDVKINFMVMLGYGFLINLLAIWNYRKTNA